MPNVASPVGARPQARHGKAVPLRQGPDGKVRGCNPRLQRVRLPPVSLISWRVHRKAQAGLGNGEVWYGKANAVPIPG